MDLRSRGLLDVGVGGLGPRDALLREGHAKVVQDGRGVLWKDRKIIVAAGGREAIGATHLES